MTGWIGRMRLKWKLLIGTVGILAVSIAAVLGVIVADIRAQAGEDIETFRNDELNRYKQNLKNYVDVAYETMRAHQANSENGVFLRERYGHRLESVIDTAEAVIADKMALVKDQKLTPAEAKAQAVREIRQMRYDGGVGYIWINDNAKPIPKMIMHSTMPQLEGKVLDDEKFSCVLARYTEGLTAKSNLFSTFVEVVERSPRGDGFVDYLWPKPTAGGVSEQLQPKLSYVRLIEPWGWVIGTGLYLDDALADAKADALATIREMRYDQDQQGYFWINDTTTPMPRMVMHPTVPELDGKILDQKEFSCVLAKYTEGLAKNDNLFSAAVKVVKESPGGHGFVDYRWPKPTKDGLTEEQPKLSYVRLFEPWGWIIGTGVYIDGIEAQAGMRAAAINEQLGALTVEILLAALLTTVFGVALAFLLAGSLFKQLGEEPTVLSDIAQRIADGDLNMALPSKGGRETGVFLAMKNMATNLNEMSLMANRIAAGDLRSRRERSTKLAEKEGTIFNVMENMRGQISAIVGEIIDASNHLVASSAEINRTADALTDGVRRQEREIQDTTATTEELNHSIQRISSSAAEMKLSTQESAEAAITYKKAIEEITGEMVRINDKTQKIGEIAGIIRDIAAQTRLISVNASIEAAKAGEFGRGFAVVADAISSLADSTSRSTKEIERLIKESVLGIRSGVESVRRSSMIYESVVSQIENNHAFAVDITESLAEQQKGSSQIQQASMEISDVSRSISTSAEELTSATDELNKLAQRLNDAVVVFEVDSIGAS